ncbi:MAG: hypothetical protein R2719_04815 [Micropruina sp.]|nr:hypothetical protein [Micropruina sp.]
MAGDAQADDPVAEREPHSADFAAVPSPAVPEDWTAVATPPAWAGPPPADPEPPSKPRNLVAAVALLSVGVALLIWGVPAVIVHIQAATGAFAELPPDGNFVRAAAAFVGFFVTFLGVGALTRTLRGGRD